MLPKTAKKKGTKIKHDKHYGYVYKGSLKCLPHGKDGDVEDHNLLHIIKSSPVKIKNCVHPQQHPSNSIPHLDHTDIIVDDRLHHVKKTHCEDHGPIKVCKKPKASQKIPFVIMILLTGIFFVVELVVGVWIQSLALQADAFHMISDVFALIIAFYSFLVSFRGHSNKATFGFGRAEIVGGLVNGVFLISSCFFITLEAIHRFIDIDEIQDQLDENIHVLMIVGGIGLLINIVGLLLFLRGTHSHGHSHNDNDENLNIRALILHITGDILGSVGVIVSGLIIKFVEDDWRFYADPIASVLIVIIILTSAIPLTKTCVTILIHKVPKHIDVFTLKNSLVRIPGIVDVHHLHVWTHSNNTVIGTVHIVTESEQDLSNIFSNVEEQLHKFHIHTTTIQMEVLDANELDNQAECQNIECQNIVCQTKECIENQCCDE